MEGTPFKIGEREFIVPRVRIIAYERAVLAVQASEKIAKEEDPFGLERLHAFNEAVVELLRENYPDLTIEEVRALNPRLDELDAILGGLIAAGGKKPVKPGEGAAP